MTDRSTLPNEILPGQNPLRRSKPGSIAAALALLYVLCWPLPAAAEVNRCQRPDGSVVYTDRRCADIGAVEQLPRHGGNRGGSSLYPSLLHRDDCSRTVEDLTFQMTMAIDAHDANQLATVYHWVGVSSRGAVQVMNGLEAVVERPLLGIEILRPEPVVVAAPEPPPPTLDPIDGSLSTPSGDADLQPQLPPVTVVTEQKPVGLRVVQTLAGTATPSNTVYRLHRYFGCFWITR